MCFYVHRQYPKELTASKDIKCYKMMDLRINLGFEDNKVQLRTEILSPYQNFKYILNRTYTSSALIIDNSGCLTIDVGLHSFSTLKKAEERASIYRPVIIECIIPKGTKYYYNPQMREYVSTKLQIVDIIQAKALEINIKGENKFYWAGDSYWPSISLNLVKIIKTKKTEFTYPKFIELLMD